jgi:hypothetical protein
VADSRIERFNVLCGEVADRLGGKPEDDVVQYVAQLKLKREDLLARDLAGERVDVVDLRWIADALAKYESISEPIKITLTCIGPDGAAVQKRDDETISEFFRRRRAEREALEPPPAATETAKDEKGAVADTPVENTAPRTTQSPTNAKPESKGPKPYHESMLKDSRPDASVNNGGAAVWWSGTNNRGSL